MKRVVYKHGTSLVFALPPALLQLLDIVKGDSVDIDYIVQNDTKPYLRITKSEKIAQNTILDDKNQGVADEKL